MLHINLLGLKSVKLALLTLSKQKSLKAVHFQIENTTAVLYLVSDLVPPTTRNVYSSSTAASKEHKPNKPIRESSPFNCKQDITTSGVDHIRENYLVREFQKQLPNLLQVQDEKI